MRPSARSVLGAVAMAAALVTVVAAAAVGGSGAYMWGGAVYLLITAFAVRYPPAIVLQVLAGQALAGALLLDPRGPGPLPVMALIAAAVATAELLGAAASLRAPFETRTSLAEDVRRVGLAASIGALAFIAVLTVGSVPGPSGLLAVLVASAACAGLAGLLLKGG